VTAFIESYRGSVAAWECDQYGHMNVQFYVGRISDAAVTVMLARGMGPKAMARHRLGIAAVDSRVTYRREVRAGALIRMESALKSLDGRKVVFLHRLFDAESGALAMQAEVLGLCFDLETRKSVPFPEEFVRLSRDSMMVGDEPEVQCAIPAPRDGMLPSFCGSVNAWECDQMGHMNVQFYLHRAAEADRQVFAAIGLPPGALRGMGAAIRPLRYHIQFRRELHSGAATAMRSGLRRAGPDHLDLVHQLVNTETGEVSAVIEARVGLADAADGRTALPVPADALERAAQIAADFAGPAELPDQTGPRMPQAPAPNMFETGRASVDSWECDEHGRLAMRFYMAAFSSAAGSLYLQDDGSAAAEQARSLGSAALDYIITFRKPLKAGSAYHIRTGFLELREKTWRFCHHLIDSGSRETVATAEIVAVMFDKASRKSVLLPDAVRRAFTERLISAPAAAAGPR